uniref:Uncharacterized protein n=1 Tax=Geospiza parvula TaxID=87175 RepID=A0A8U8BK42_GEOPR
ITEYTDSPSEHCQVRYSGSLAHTPSSEKISPIKFPALNSTIELSPPHNCLYEPPDVASDDEKEMEDNGAFQEDNFSDEAGKTQIKKKKKKRNLKLKRNLKMKCTQEDKHKQDKHQDKELKDVTAVDIVKQLEGNLSRKPGEFHICVFYTTDSGEFREARRIFQLLSDYFKTDFLQVI